MRKAQAAMEFLMTYGWAILVVLAAIGALAYFGVLSPDKLIAEKCVLSSGLACLDRSYDAVTGVNVYVQNAGGFDMAAVTAALAGTGCTANNDGGAVATLDNGQATTFTFSTGGCDALTGRYKGTLTVTYTNAVTGLVHTNTGDIIVDAG